MKLTSSPQELFDHQARTQRLNRGLGLGAVLRDDHAFARREPVRFNHHRCVELGERGNPRFDRLHASVASSGNSKALHEFLGVDLAAFELRGILRGPDDLALGRAELVDHAGDQRNFGTDDGEIGIDGVRRGQVIRGRQKLTELGDSGIARARHRSDDLLAPGATRSHARGRRCQ